MKSILKVRASAYYLILSTLAILAFGFTSNDPADSLPAFNKDCLEQGDLVFIQGTSWRSRVVLLREKPGRSFSHVGVLVCDRGEWTVVHATPTSHGERVECVIEEPLESFVSDEEAEIIGIFRLEGLDPGSASMICREAKKAARARIPFDHDFDATNSEAQYCTELVRDLFQGIGYSFLIDPDEELILPSDLYLAKGIETVGIFGRGSRFEQRGGN